MRRFVNIRIPVSGLEQARRQQHAITPADARDDAANWLQRELTALIERRSPKSAEDIAGTWLGLHRAIRCESDRGQDRQHQPGGWQWDHGDCEAAGCDYDMTGKRRYRGAFRSERQHRKNPDTLGALTRP